MVIATTRSATPKRHQAYVALCAPITFRATLSVAKLIEPPADRILWPDCECVAKGTVREADGEIGIEHEEALANRLHEIPRVNFAHGNGSCSPSDEGARPRQQEYDPCQRTPPSALLVYQLCPSWDVLSVMYITDSVGSLLFYVYVLGR